jgi:NAD(P)-dependent dehydrogenase (short-subunit alcohol dehydrogenase family)
MTQASTTNSLRFDGKVAIVTGAGRGLGREYALLLAARGASVVVNDIAIGPNGDDEGGPSPAREVVEEIMQTGGRATASVHSVADGAARIVADAVEAYGRIDILINNAGISGGGLFPDIDPAQWQRLLDIHAGGTVAMCREAWPHLRAAGAGRIVNMSSSASMGAQYTAHYSTAKAAVIGLTRTLAIEGAPMGITANAVMPSAYTRLTAQVPNEPLRQFLEERFPASRVAPFVAWLAHERTHVNGETFTVGAGRAARVAFVVGEGAQVAEDSPEAWAAAAGQVMSLDNGATPASMMQELCFSLRCLGPDGASMADALDNVAGRGKTAF